MIEKFNQNRPYTLECQHLQALLDALLEDNYKIVGPIVKDGAVTFDYMTSVNDLPEGWTDTQDGGRYRLKKRDDGALFGYNAGPQSIKKYLHPPRRKLWDATHLGDGFSFTPVKSRPGKTAFLGLRACDLHAMHIQDKVFLGGAFINDDYQSRRQDVFIIAVNCGQAGGTCFCTSMKTGPKVEFGYDIALTEIIEGAHHYFLIEIGTAAGADIVAGLPLREAQTIDIERAECIIRETAKSMGRHLDTTNIKELLYDNPEHPRWDDVATRCLSCANCTMVCPTCFCTSVEDTSDLDGRHAERWQRWDSCFTLDFSSIHGNAVRSSTRSRYRQWMTHKLASWIDQFGSSGCVGCGRCITWCPVGIDITEEVRMIRNDSKSDA